MPLPFAPRLDFARGDYVWSTARSALAAGDPDVEAIVRVLRTPRGSFLPDPEYGVDFHAFVHRRPNVEADAQREILRALRRTITLRSLRDVTVRVTARGEHLEALVSFRSRAGVAASARATL